MASGGGQGPQRGRWRVKGKARLKAPSGSDASPLLTSLVSHCSLLSVEGPSGGPFSQAQRADG